MQVLRRPDRQMPYKFIRIILRKFLKETAGLYSSDFLLFAFFSCSLILRPIILLCSPFLPNTVVILIFPYILEPWACHIRDISSSSSSVLFPALALQGAVPLPSTLGSRPPQLMRRPKRRFMISEMWRNHQPDPLCLLSARLTVDTRSYVPSTRSDHNAKYSWWNQIESKLIWIRTFWVWNRMHLSSDDSCFWYILYSKSPSTNSMCMPPIIIHNLSVI